MCSQSIWCPSARCVGRKAEWHHRCWRCTTESLASPACAGGGPRASLCSLHSHPRRRRADLRTWQCLLARCGANAPRLWTPPHRPSA
eukprot:5955062-Prymnesium_polylepis.2